MLRTARPRAAAFTLVEVLLAVALIGILASVSILNFPAMIAAAENPPLETRIGSALREARLVCLRRKALMTLSFATSGEPDEEPTALFQGITDDGFSWSETLPPEVESLAFLPDASLPGEDTTETGIIGPTGRLGFSGIRIGIAGEEPVEILFHPNHAGITDEQTLATFEPDEF